MLYSLNAQYATRGHEICSQNHAYTSNVMLNYFNLIKLLD